MKIKPGYLLLHFIALLPCFFPCYIKASPIKQYEELNQRISLFGITVERDSIAKVSIMLKDTTNVSKIGIYFSTDSVNISEQFIEFSLANFRRPEFQLYWDNIDTIFAREKVYDFKRIMREGKGQLDVLLHLDYGKTYFVKAYIIDNDNQEHLTKQKTYSMHEKNPDQSMEISLYDWILILLAFGFTSMSFMLIPTSMFIYFIFFKKYKVNRSLKHVGVYILLCIPLVLISGFFNFMAGFGRGGSSPPYLFISIGVLAILYLIILNWWTIRKAQGNRG